MKKTSFDFSSMCKFAPRRFDQFDVCNLLGPLGLLVLWNSKVFSGTIMLQESFGIAINFIASASAQPWTLVNVYGPCTKPRRSEFISWPSELDILDDDLWLLMGDFNFYRYTENRNTAGADMNDILIFNEFINHLGLIELPIKGRSFTWSNMQHEPLLEQLDGFFTSTAWTNKFPNTPLHPPV